MNTREKVVFVGLDASKATLALSGADDGRGGEIRDIVIVFMLLHW